MVAPKQRPPIFSKAPSRALATGRCGPSITDAQRTAWGSIPPFATEYQGVEGCNATRHCRACGCILKGDRPVPTEVSASAAARASISSVVKDPDTFEAEEPARRACQVTGWQLRTWEALVFLPRERQRRLPLLLYLHGAGEMRGSLQEIISEARKAKGF